MGGQASERRSPRSEGGEPAEETTAARTIYLPMLRTCTPSACRQVYHLPERCAESHLGRQVCALNGLVAAITKLKALVAPLPARSCLCSADNPSAGLANDFALVIKQETDGEGRFDSLGKSRFHRQRHDAFWPIAFTVATVHSKVCARSSGQTAERRLRKEDKRVSFPLVRRGFCPNVEARRCQKRGNRPNTNYVSTKPAQYSPIHPNNFDPEYCP